MLTSNYIHYSAVLNTNKNSVIHETTYDWIEFENNLLSRVSYSRRIFTCDPIVIQNEERFRRVCKNPLITGVGIPPHPLNFK